MISCTDELFRITPPRPCCRNSRNASREHKNGPRRFTASTLSKSAAAISCDAAGFWIPALLINTSIELNSFTNAANIACTCSSFETSAATIISRPAAPCRAAAACRAVSSAPSGPPI